MYVREMVIGSRRHAKDAYKLVEGCSLRGVQCAVALVASALSPVSSGMPVPLQ